MCAYIGDKTNYYFLLNSISKKNCCYFSTDILTRKLPHYHFSWIVSFQKQRYHICEMLPLETKLSGGKLLPNRISGGNVSRGNVMQALRQEEVRISQIQDSNMECKDFESRRKIGEFENGNAEE